MKNTTLLALLALLPAAWSAQAQVVTTEPPIVQTDSRNIVITFHADQGSGELAGQPASAKLYAHTGVITDRSTSDSNWRYTSSWSKNETKYQLTYVSPNTWSLTIPSIAEYYGVPASETVEKLAFVFRNATGSLTGKTADGGDIFVNVLPAGFQMQFIEDQVITSSAPVSLKVNSTEPADLYIYVNKTEIANAMSSISLTGEYAFSTAGDYQVEAVAVKEDGTRISKTATITRIGDSAAATYPGGIPQMGAVTQPDGSTIFCIAAPGKKSVALVGSWNDYAVKAADVMNYQDYDGQRYFWKSVPDLQPGEDYIYYYLVDGKTRVGDPYAHLVLDPWNDQYISSTVFPNLPKYPSDKVQSVPLAWYNSNLDDYDWKYSDDFKGVAQSDLIVYELLIRDFTGKEGAAQGSGTLQGVMDKLDYLEGLGVNAIELLPIMEFNGNNSWGYNTNFYLAPDKAYGTPSDYKALIDECHRRGIAVILDIVFNQSDGLHPWYQMYPIDKNPFYNGSAPHAYSVLNDWNQDNPFVMQQWQDALSYWMTTYKVDGFRFDLVKGLGNNDSYNNTYYPETNTWGTPTDAGTNAYNRSRVNRMAELHAWMRTVNPDAYFINENLAGAQEENEMAADGDANWANINTESCQFAMGYSSNASLNRFYAPLDSRTWGSTVSYAESHDEERMAYKQSRYGASGVKGNRAVSCRRLGSVAAQMLMTPGAHMIWQFQEFGADQSTKDSNGGNNTSPKRVIWNYLNDPDRNGLMQNYSELNRIRANNPQLFTEQASSNILLASWNTARTLTLANGASQLALMVNPSVTDNMTVTLPLSGKCEDYQVMSASYGVDYTISGNQVTLAPGAYIVLGSKNLDSVETLPAEDTEALKAVSVAADAGTIRIRGEYSSAKAYTLDGREVPLSGLPSALYLVVVDGQPFNVLMH